MCFFFLRWASGECISFLWFFFFFFFFEISVRCVVFSFFVGLVMDVVGWSGVFFCFGWKFLVRSRMRERMLDGMIEIWNF